jgi:voltage-gated potassium channel
MNVTAASLETVDAIYLSYQSIFIQFEIFSVVMFSIEFLLRLWSAPAAENYTSRINYLLSFDAIVDLLAIAPFYISILFGIDLRALVSLRLLRLLKLVRYFDALSILAAVMKAEARAFAAAIFILMILVFVASAGIYFFEGQAQPEVFGSIPQSMWWAIVTLTTLGYGDVVPVTVAGQIFAASITIMSIGTVALPAGMLASRFSEELHKRKFNMAEQISAFKAGDLASQHDESELDEYRKKMCLSVDDMQRLLEGQDENAKTCPLCGSERRHD